MSLQVSFCNLIKRDRDRTNHLWVAEGTETSTYHLSYDHPHCSHLKRSVSFLKNWVKTSGSVCFLGVFICYHIGFCVLVLYSFIWCDAENWTAEGESYIHYQQLSSIGAQVCWNLIFFEGKIQSIQLFCCVLDMFFTLCFLFPILLMLVLVK